MPAERIEVPWGGAETVWAGVGAVVWFVAVLVLRPANVRSAAAYAAGPRGVPALDERLDCEPPPGGVLPS